MALSSGPFTEKKPTENLSAFSVVLSGNHHAVSQSTVPIKISLEFNSDPP